jgi:hypothetical protein
MHGGPVVRTIARAWNYLVFGMSFLMISSGKPDEIMPDKVELRSLSRHRCLFYKENSGNGRIAGQPGRYRYTHAGGRRA